MSWVYPESLGETLDMAQDWVLAEREVPPDAVARIVTEVASRLDGAGAYRIGMVAPSPGENRETTRTYLGDRFANNACVAHTLAEEAATVLGRLAPEDPCVKSIVTGVAAFQERRRTYPINRGRYCCPTCTAALWRALTVTELPGYEEDLSNGLRFLRTRRDGDGQWIGFPFFWTLLALTEIPLPEARNEILYAASAWDRRLATDRSEHPYRERRREVVARARELVR
jgi:hypothetical protein